MGPLVLPAITASASLLGRLFGNAAKGSAENRRADNTQNMQQAQLNNSDAITRAGLINNDSLTRAGLLNTDGLTRAGLISTDAMNRARLDLDRRTYALDEPNAQAGQAVRGSLLQNLQPLQFSGLSSRAAARMPQLNSIINAINPDARQAGGLLSQRGLSGLQSGPTQFSDVAALALPPALTLPPAFNLPPAQVAALQKSGLLEKILGAAGLIGSTVGALGTLAKPKPTSGNGLPIEPMPGGKE